MCFCCILQCFVNFNILPQATKKSANHDLEIFTPPLTPPAKPTGEKLKAMFIAFRHRVVAGEGCNYLMPRQKVQWPLLLGWRPLLLMTKKCNDYDSTIMSFIMTKSSAARRHTAALILLQIILQGWPQVSLLVYILWFSYIIMLVFLSVFLCGHYIYIYTVHQQDCEPPAACQGLEHLQYMNVTL